MSFAFGKLTTTVGYTPVNAHSLTESRQTNMFASVGSIKSFMYELANTLVKFGTLSLSHMALLVAQAATSVPDGLIGYVPEPRMCGSIKRASFPKLSCTTIVLYLRQPE